MSLMNHYFRDVPDYYDTMYMDGYSPEQILHAAHQTMIRARVRSGVANARAKGRQIGRPQVTAQDLPSGFLRHYHAYKKGQLNVSELARVCDLSRTTVYKYIELLEKN